MFCLIYNCIIIVNKKDCSACTTKFVACYFSSCYADVEYVINNFNLSMDDNFTIDWSYPYYVGEQCSQTYFYSWYLENKANWTNDTLEEFMGMLFQCMYNDVTGYCMDSSDSGMNADGMCTSTFWDALNCLFTECLDTGITTIYPTKSPTSIPTADPTDSPVVPDPATSANPTFAPTPPTIVQIGDKSNAVMFAFNSVFYFSIAWVILHFQ